MLINSKPDICLNITETIPCFFLDCRVLNDDDDRKDMPRCIIIKDSYATRSLETKVKD